MEVSCYTLKDNILRMSIDNELLIRYLSGDCKDDECEALLTWVENSDENKRHFAEMKNSWVISNIQANKVNQNETADSFKSVLNKIQNSENGSENSSSPKISIFWRIAATVIITIGLTSLINYLIWSEPEKITAYNELSVPSGQQAQLTLADGTHIWLNSKSKLIYPGEFSSKTREVILEGEGYFQVSHNPEKPFIVKTSHLDVKVLGTSFNITNYSDEDKISFALESGSISLLEKGTENSKLKLKPTDLAVFSKTTHDIQLSKGDADIYKSWLKGQFKFRNLSFEDIARRLGRNFNVQFVFENEKVKKIKYNGSFYNYEPLHQILKIMQTNSAFRYRIVKDKVFIE